MCCLFYELSLGKGKKGDVSFWRQNSPRQFAVAWKNKLFFRAFAFLIFSDFYFCLFLFSSTDIRDYFTNSKKSVNYDSELDRLIGLFIIITDGNVSETDTDLGGVSYFGIVLLTC